MKICFKCKENLSKTQFGKDSSKIDGLYSNCKACRAIKNKAKYLATQLWCFNKGGSKCQDCGISDQPPGFYDWHHIDPTTKVLEVGAMFVGGKQNQRLLDELEKCVLVCPNCHRKRHLCN